MHKSRYGVFPLVEADRPDFLAHMLSLDPEARRRRFGSCLSDYALERVCQSLPLEGKAWGIYIWGQLKGTTLVIPYKDEPGHGEFAITLSPSLRGRGWGRFLTRSALQTAYQDGFAKVDVYYLHENEAMARICASYPGPLSRDSGDCLKVVCLEEWVTQEMVPSGLVEYA